MASSNEGDDCRVPVRVPRAAERGARRRAGLPLVFTTMFTATWLARGDGHPGHHGRGRAPGVRRSHLFVHGKLFTARSPQAHTCSRPGPRKTPRNTSPPKQIFGPMRAHYQGLVQQSRLSPLARECDVRRRSQ